MAAADCRWACPRRCITSAAARPRIVITGPEEALRRVRVGEGHIGREESWIGSFGDERLEVIVTGVALDRISIGGSGKVLLGRLDQDRLDLNIGGSGSISGEGRIDRVQVNIGGSGKVDLARAVSTEASIRIGGSGDVDVAPRENASVSIAGSGSVRLAVRPEHLHSKVAGSGRILLPNKDGGYTDAVQMTRGMSRVDY